MSEEMFGSDDGGAWGAADPMDPGGESLSGSEQIAPGMFMQLDQDFIKELLRAPEAISAITRRGAQIADAANGSSITKGAVYESKYVDNGGKRPVVFVKPATFEAVLDEKFHSTLLKAAATIGSDPVASSNQPAGQAGLE